jgi:16S rRNA (guanine527-N7)-methyltransferase
MPAQQRQLAVILERLETDAEAPTTVRAPQEAVGVHVADSLVALEVASLREARFIADLGSGAGFPGLALAVALPATEVRLVDSQRRKCAFVEVVCRAAGIDNARSVWSRVEEWTEGIGTNDVVVARALAPQPVVLEYAAPLLRVGGELVDWRGRRNESEEQRAAVAAQRLGMSLLEIRRVEPYEGARDHHLHVYRKTAETPSSFPRRAGAARKHPIGC